MITNLSEETILTVITALDIADDEAGSSESAGMNFSEVTDIFLEMVAANFGQFQFGGPLQKATLDRVKKYF